jgi:hypothetical protein
MDARILILNARCRVKHSALVEVHLSTLGGLHVIPSTDRDFGNVFQATIRGRWESPSVFYCITGERLIVDADGRARWGVDVWQLHARGQLEERAYLYQSNFSARTRSLIAFPN